MKLLEPSQLYFLKWNIKNFLASSLKYINNEDGRVFRVKTGEVKSKRDPKLTEATIYLHFENNGYSTTHSEYNRYLNVELLHSTDAYSEYDFLEDLCYLGLVSYEADRGKKFTIDLNSLTYSTWVKIVGYGIRKDLDIINKVKKFQIGKSQYKEGFLVIAIDVETAVWMKEKDFPLVYELEKNKKLSLKKFVSQYMWVEPEAIGIQIFEAPKGFEDTLYFEPHIFYKQNKKIGEKDYQPLFDLFEKWEKKYYILLMAHNAAYDAIHLKRVYHQHDTQVHLKLKEKNKFLLSGKTVGKHSHEWGDTFLIYNQSLEDATGEEKEVFDYNMLNPKFDFETGIVTYTSKEDPLGEFKFSSLSDYSAYLKKDVRGVVKLLREWRHMTEWIHGELSLGRRLPNKKPDKYEFKNYSRATQAGLSKRCLLAIIRDTYYGQHSDMVNKSYEFYNDIFRYPITEEEYWRQHISNIAGFVGIVKSSQKEASHYVCEEDSKIVKFDINSSYPNIMLHSGVPGGPLLTEEEMKGKNKADYVTWYLLKPKGDYLPHLNEYFDDVVSADVLRSTLFVPKKNDKLTEHYLCSELYELAKWAHPDIEASLKEPPIPFYQKRRGEHKRLVSYFWPYRKTFQDIYKDLSKSDIERDSAILKEKMVKIILNSSYGQMLMRRYEVSYYYVNGDVDSQVESPPFRSTLAGVYIAQMGRAVLLEQIKKIFEKGHKIFHYDTDSITFKVPKNLDPTTLFPTGVGRELGMWKFEGTFTDCWTFYNTRKKYVLWDRNNPTNISVAMSGIKRAPKLIKYLAKNNTERFFEFMKDISSPSVGFEKGSGKTYTARDNGEQVIYDVYRGMGDRERGRATKDVYKKVLRIDPDCKDYKIIV